MSSVFYKKDPISKNVYKKLIESSSQFIFRSLEYCSNQKHLEVFNLNNHVSDLLR